MPRKSRIDAAGAIHHVIARGINRADIFSDDGDYKSVTTQEPGVRIQESE